MKTELEMPELFAGIVKRDDARREVTGVLAEEAVDKANEIFDYESSKPYFQSWNEQFLKVTGGNHVGNVREMHQPSAVGKFVDMVYDDVAKRILVTAKIADDAAWKKVVDQVYTGFSVGGKYIRKWSDGDYTRYTARPSEGSLVDNPCMYGAEFTAVKADGSTEVLKFAPHDLEKAAPTKRVAGEDLRSSAFAYVGDPTQPKTWKLPIKFSDDEKTKNHIRAALAMFSRTRGIPAGERPKVKAKIEAAAKRNGIDAEKMAKGLMAVSDTADVLATLNCIRIWAEMEADTEGDDSAVPARLQSLVEELGALLVDMAAEETAELTGAKADAPAGADAVGNIAEHAAAILKLLGAPGSAPIQQPKETQMETSQPDLHKIAEHEASLKKINEQLAAIPTLQKDMDDFKKDVTAAISNLADAVKKLNAQEVPPKAAKMSVAVQKTDDVADKARSGAGEKAPTTTELIKRVHRGA